MYESDAPLVAALDSLRTSLLLSSAANLVLVLLVSSLFENTTGFCDDEATASRSSFRFIVLFQVLINTPAFIYYHRADKETSKDDGNDDGIKQSFLFFIGAFLVKLYVTLTTFLVGPFEDKYFIGLVSLFLLLSGAAYVCVRRYETRTVVTLY